MVIQEVHYSHIWEQMKSPVPIPVELVSFSASLIKVDVVLTWQTATELNNRDFDIERNRTGELTGNLLVTYLLRVIQQQQAIIDFTDETVPAVTYL